MSEIDELIEAVRETFYALRAASTRLLEDLACSATERGVLMEIGTHGPRTVPVMARFRSISRQAMQKTVDSMIDRTWLRTEPNPDHARSQLISLTPAGEKLLALIKRREAAMTESAQLPVTAAELARTTSVLAKLRPYFEDVR